MEADFLGGIVKLGKAIAFASPRRRVILGTDNVALAIRIIMRESPEGSCYIHFWLNSDQEPFHDHPWDFTSLILQGQYKEVTPVGERLAVAGDILIHRAEDKHRIELVPSPLQPVSLVLTGPNRREWGFYFEDGYRDGLRWVADHPLLPGAFAVATRIALAL